MPQFTYRARNAQGGLVEGVLDCADRAVAIHQIESQHCIPIRIDMVETAKPAEAKASPAAPAQRKLRLLGSPENASPTQSLKIPHGQLLIFTEQLAHLLQAGMTLDEGLSILEKRLKQPRVQQMTHTLHQALVDGRSFSQALSDMPRIFPPPSAKLASVALSSSSNSRRWRWIASTMARSPLYQLARLVSCTLSITWPRSPSRPSRNRPRLDVTRRKPRRLKRSTENAWGACSQN